MTSNWSNLGNEYSCRNTAVFADFVVESFATILDQSLSETKKSFKYDDGCPGRLPHTLLSHS